MYDNLFCKLHETLVTVKVIHCLRLYFSKKKQFCVVKRAVSKCGENSSFLRNAGRFPQFEQPSSAVYIMNHLSLLENCQPQDGKLTLTTGSSTEIKIICLWIITWLP